MAQQLIRQPTKKLAKCKESVVHAIFIYSIPILVFSSSPRQTKVRTSVIWKNQNWMSITAPKMNTDRKTVRSSAQSELLEKERSDDIPHQKVLTHRLLVICYYLLCMIVGHKSQLKQHISTEYQQPQVAISFIFGIPCFFYERFTSYLSEMIECYHN